MKPQRKLRDAFRKVALSGKGASDEAGSTARFSVVSLFAGCGGMDLGFCGGFDFLGRHYERNGFEVIWANEINPHACATYRLNLGEHIVEGDINACMGRLPVYADVVIGGFPCQDISINGKMLGLAGKRSSLYTVIVETVSRLRPKVFVAENVGSLLMKKHAAALQRILADFTALGYDVTHHLYCAEKYGVPQTRSRVIFVGTRSDLPAFVPPEPCGAPPVTAREALEDLEGRPQDQAFSHVWSAAKVSGEQGNRHLVADCPGYTIRAECHGNIQFHYALPRRISMREAARIQSFPDSFRFVSGIRATERQIGNAVPPVLAWHVARSVQAVLRGRSRAGCGRVGRRRKVCF